MRGAQLAGELEPARPHVDPDDRGAPGDAGGDHGRQANGPGAEHGDPRPGLRTQRVEDGARAGLDAAPERRDDLERDVGIELGDVALGRQRVGRKARLPEEVRVDRGAVTDAPTASTTPAPSWPSTAGSGTGYHWSRTIRSVWQMPQATTRTSTSSARSSSSSSSSISNAAPLDLVTAARISIEPSSATA
jgi:hypothetical protein